MMVTATEREVLTLIDYGYTSDEVAQRLSLTASTIDSYLSDSYRKLHVSNFVDAMRALDSIDRIKPLINCLVCHP